MPLVAEFYCISTLAVEHFNWNPWYQTYYRSVSNSFKHSESKKWQPYQKSSLRVGHWHSAGWIQEAIWYNQELPQARKLYLYHPHILLARIYHTQIVLWIDPLGSVVWDQMYHYWCKMVVCLHLCHRKYQSVDQFTWEAWHRVVIFMVGSKWIPYWINWK